MKWEIMGKVNFGIPNPCAGCSSHPGGTKELNRIFIIRYRWKQAQVVLLPLSTG